MARIEPLSSGIYEMACSGSAKRYIGSAANVYFRIGSHVRQLVLGKHPNAALQSDWNAHGQSMFSFRLIENIDDPAARLKREKMLIQSIDHQQLYNEVWATKPRVRRPATSGPKIPNVMPPTVPLGSLAELVTITQLARLCNVTRRTVYHWLRAGKAPGCSIAPDARIYFDRAEAEQFALAWTDGRNSRRGEAKVMK